MKVLIAEDEPNTLQIIQITLEARGHQVITAGDGEECVNVYRNEFFACAKQHRSSSGFKAKSGEPFDFVILDIRMPKKTGTQAAKEILALNPDQRIFFASAYCVAVLEEAKLQWQNRFEWLQKPFEMDLFADMLEDAQVK